MEDSVPAPPPLKEGPRPSRQNPLGVWVLAALALAVGIALALSTCSAPQRKAIADLSGAPSVGAEALYTLVLPRGDITAAQQADNSPLSLTIKSIQPTENQEFAYLISYSGVERGTFNLTDYLCTPNGDRLRAPITPVQVNSYISDSADYAIRNLPVPRHPAPTPYTALLFVSVAAWLGTGIWMFFPEKRIRKTSTPAPPQLEDAVAFTLEDLLRPLVEKAANKTISVEEKARMEQILFQYWGALLQLDHLNSVEQLRRILEHKEAGALLRTVEQWLYQPDSKIPPEEISLILKPYLDLPVSAQSIPAEEEPEAPEFTS